MKRKNHKHLKRFVRYLYRTRYNKILALVMIGCGLLTGKFGDGTGMLFALIFGVPLFFAKENHIYGGEP